MFQKIQPKQDNMRGQRSLSRFLVAWLRSKVLKYNFAFVLHTDPVPDLDPRFYLNANLQAGSGSSLRLKKIIMKNSHLFPIFRLVLQMI